MIGYKLFSLRKNGTLGSLFIHRRQVLPLGRWLRAECFPTKGFAVRTGWHVTPAPHAPHLSMKGRVWAEVELRDWSRLPRPACQGGVWLLARWMRIVRILPPTSP